jgi:pSer/pThr/pTyr-binding forkhead associated (FHA) protein
MIVRKLVVTDGRTERELLLVGTIVVGRDPSCQLNDLDPLLSRRHAEFVTTSKGVTVRDLKSRNGILVNGDKVPEHALKPGDVIQLGHLHVRYVEEPVVKSPEDHSRVRAKTETGIEVPTMAVSRPAPAPLSPTASATAKAPTQAAPMPPAATVDTDLDVTVAVPRRGTAAAPPARPAKPALPDADLDATVAVPRRKGAVPAPPAATADTQKPDLDATIAVSRPAPPPPAPPPPPAASAGTPAGESDLDPDVTIVATPGKSTRAKLPAFHAADNLDMDATIARPRPTPAAPAPSSAPPAPASEDVDPDATRLVWADAAEALGQDPDATAAAAAASLDETRLTTPAAGTSVTPRASTAAEARVVANMSLVVTEASPNCQTVIGARPETMVGGHLSDLLTRILRFVATGDGPQALSFTVTRATTGNTITLTCKTGIENHS